MTTRNKQQQEQEQKQKQISCGNDKKKSKNNGKDNSNSNGKSKGFVGWCMREILMNKFGEGKANVLAFRRSSGEARYASARETIYALIAQSSDGMTCKEIAQCTGWAIHTFGGRLVELKEAGKIRGTGQKRYGAEVLIAYRAFPMLWLMEAA